MLNSTQHTAHSTQHTAHSTNSLNDLKLLSVIIPAYNAEKYLEKCAASIAEQSYKNIEIVIVNNGSADSTPKICEELKAKYNNRIFKIINLNPNQGINWARRAGVENADGEYIAFIDSDDYLEPETYETSIKILENNNCDLAQFGIKLVNLDGELIKTWGRDDLIFNNSSDIYKYFLTDKTPTWDMWDKVYKRNLFENLEWPKISALEDYCMSAQIFAKADKLITINKNFYNWLQRPDSTGQSNKLSKLDDVLAASELVINLTLEKFPEMLPDALAREMGGLSNFLLDFWPQVSQVIRKNYINMLNEFKARGIKIKASTAENQKLLLHAHYLTTHPVLYKAYLTTRLAINKLTGI